MSKRIYTQVQDHKGKIYQLKAEGKTNQEIADILGFANKWVVKEIIIASESLLCSILFRQKNRHFFDGLETNDRAFYLLILF